MKSKAARKWMVPEVIQTSAMDCGPAALKCLLESFHIAVDYGRLRDACQTSVDGTSIDDLEAMATQLGLEAEQVMLPPDFLWIPEAKVLPAMLVIRLAHGPTHFVVVWRRVGRWVQLMDPAMGRRWVSCESLQRELLVHKVEVPAADWLEWAISAETLAVFSSRLRSLGASAQQAADIIRRQQAKQAWQAMAQLDAALRMLSSLVDAGGLKRGAATLRLLASLLADDLPDERDNKSASIPTRYWAVDAIPSTGEVSRLLLSGAVLLRVRGKRSDVERAEPQAALSSELSAALHEQPVQPTRTLWTLIRADGVLTPLTLVAVIGLAMGALVVEALLFRGLFEMAQELNLVRQRAVAFIGLLMFVLILWAFEVPIVIKSLQLGRHLEVRLRVMLLAKLPKLNDHYFQSRPASDLAERSHSLYLLRNLPELAVNFVRVGWELLFTLVGIAWIARASLPLAAGMALLVVGITMVAQPMMRERDLRVRIHFGAMQRFYLDSLLGSIPIRTHSAERSVRREHEAMLVQWVRAATHQLRLSLWVDGQRALGCLALAGWLLFLHIQAVGITGDLLLLAYWVLKLPTLGERFAILSLQYPTQRNIALRLLDPINSPEEVEAESLGNDPVHRKPAERPYAGVSLSFQNVAATAAGYSILRDIQLSINSGEHIAIVGPSGAGKSSLLGLLLGWHQAASGEILVDGEPLTGERLLQLRKQTAWVDPAVHIWNRSLIENLRYSPAAGPQSDLGNILEKADLTAVLARLPEGLQSGMGEGGARLSGGEGQRVRLARAMGQRGVRLVLLDEPFRGLDRQQRRHHLLQCRQHWRQATLICITHDIRETQSFDRVLVIEDGSIVEDGCPSVLAADQNSRYRGLLSSEIALYRELWNAPVWRRLQFEHGQIREVNKATKVRRAEGLKVL